MEKLLAFEKTYRARLRNQLVILPVSIDDSADIAAKAIKLRGWDSLPHYVSTGKVKGFQSLVGRAFVIDRIPTAIFIGPNGKILWRGNPGLTDVLKIINEKMRQRRQPRPKKDQQQAATKKGSQKRANKTPPIGSLDAAIADVNRQAKMHPVSAKLSPLTKKQVLAGIATMKKTTWLTDAEFQSLKQIAVTGRMPKGAKLKQFVRYDDGDRVLHGWWIRLMLFRKDRGPYSQTIRKQILFRRPYTQKERLYRTRVKSRGGFSSLSALISHFDADPNFNQPIKPSIDYKSLVTITKSVAALQGEFASLMKHSHLTGVTKAQRLEIESELRKLFKRPIDIGGISFQRRRYKGTLRHWRGFVVYGANLSVEGYIKLPFTDKKQPRAAYLEVGPVKGKPKFACTVAKIDGLTGRIGKPLPPFSLSAFTLATPKKGVYERGVMIKAPGIVDLQQANLEIWQFRFGQR